MNYSICIDAIFNGKDFLQSMKSINDIGFDTFEFWSWWDKDIDRINTLRKELNMTVSAFCVPFISLVDDSTHTQYITELKKTISIAKKLGCHKLISQVGNQLFDIDKNTQTQNLIKGMQSCIPYLEEANITLVYEPLNTLLDHKGYFLHSSDEAFTIQEKVNSSNIKVLFDIYHQLVMGEDPYKQITDNIDKIGHFHAAGYPGRHELSTATFNYQSLFNHISSLDYTGYMGMEYMPLGDSIESLKDLVF